MSRRAWKVSGLVVLLFAAAVPALSGRAADDRAGSGFVSLFNGKDLAGWRYSGASGVSLAGKTETPDGRVVVQDGVIVMKATDRQGRGGIKGLYTLKSYDKPFRLQVEFRAGLKADSGVYVRGPQLQVRDFIRRNEQKHLTKFKNDGWNELDITVRNGVVTTTLNGRALTERDTLELVVRNAKPEARLNGKPVAVSQLAVSSGARADCLCNGEPLQVMTNLPASGPIGLQAETGKFEFRNVRLKELE